MIQNLVDVMVLGRCPILRHNDVKPLHLALLNRKLLVKTSRKTAKPSADLIGKTYQLHIGCNNYIYKTFDEETIICYN